MSEFILHQWDMSPFCRKIRKILQIKGQPYQVVNYNGLDARKAARLSPVGKLPVLQFGNEKIQDSHVIALWLETQFPEPALMPKDAAAIAQVRVFEDWADESLYWYEVFFRFRYPEATEKALTLICEGRPAWERPLVKLIVGMSLRRSLRAQGLGRMSKGQVEKRFGEILDALESLLHKSPWLVGGQQSLADIAVSSQLDEMVRTSHLKDSILSRPRLADWLQANGPAS